MDADTVDVDPRRDADLGAAGVGAAGGGATGVGAAGGDAGPEGRRQRDHAIPGHGEPGGSRSDLTGVREARVPRPIVAIAEVRDTPLSVDECLAAVALPDVGGTALFVGTVRNHDHGRRVAELEYVAHPSAGAQIERVALHVAAIAGVRAVAVVHRVGVLDVGDLAVVVAAGAAHRAEAFTACRQLIDMVKETVPIWKRQIFDDNSIEWVGGA